MLTGHDYLRSYFLAETCVLPNSHLRRTPNPALG